MDTGSSSGSGSFLTTTTGIATTTAFFDSFSASRLSFSSLAASISANIQKSLDRLETRPLQQVTIEAENAKLFFTDAGMGILVVTTEKDVNIGLIRLEIKNAVEKLRTDTQE